MILVYAAVLLGILIFVHELGHFMVAKSLGIKVLKFSLGFGPKVIGKRYGETEYLLSAFPLGGYVKMLGEEPGEELDEAEKQRAYSSQSAGKRFAVVVSGPLFNLFFAVVIFIILYLTGIPVQSPYVGKIMEESPAAKSGFMTGDRILEINGRAVHDWEDVEDLADKGKGSPMHVKLERENAIISLDVTPKRKAMKDLFGAEHEIFDIGMSALIQPVIGETVRGMPARKAGLKKGDRIMEVGGKEIVMWEEMTEIVHANPNIPLRFKIKRGGYIFDVTITPEKRSIPVSLKEEKFVGQIGIKFLKDDLTKSFDLLQSLRLGVLKAWDTCVLTVVVLVKLIQRAIPASTMGGPLMIVQMAGEQADEGLFYFLSLMAAISVNLGVLNLFPVPVLDGGHLVFITLEAIRKKPLSEKVMMTAQKIGLALLLTLMVFVTYNDIIRLVTGRTF